MAAADQANASSIRIAARIPQDVRVLLTDQQAHDVATRLVPTATRHRLAWRASTRLFGRRYYVAVLAGSDARAPRRVRDDGQVISFLSLLARIVLFAGWITLAALVTALAGLVLIYLAKSHLGIDVLQGPSFLHDFFF